MIDPDYVVGIVDAMLTQLDYLIRLGDSVPEMDADELRQIHDRLNGYKVGLIAPLLYP